jgi:RES domain-containing protein
MLVYRVAPRAFARDVSGEGARLFGGRWNPKGKPALYTAESAALAMLENLAHYALSGAPPDLVLVTIDIPDNATISKPRLEELPADWDAFPYTPATANWGPRWLNAGAASILQVPSIIAPKGFGWNYILNPLHPELVGISIKTEVTWEIDERIARYFPKGRSPKS